MAKRESGTDRRVLSMRLTRVDGPSVGLHPQAEGVLRGVLDRPSGVAERPEYAPDIDADDIEFCNACGCSFVTQCNCDGWEDR